MANVNSNRTQYEGGCEFIAICSDIRRLENNPNEDLMDQYDNLCTWPQPRCLLRKGYSQKLNNDLRV